MTKQEIESAVGETLALVLGRELPDPTAVSRATDPHWDSLKHVELLFALEDRIGVRYSEEEMAELDSYVKLVAHAEAHLAA